MSIAADFKVLGEDILASYDTRVKAIGTIVSDVSKTLKGFAADRRKMAAEQTKALADFVADLTKNVGTMLSRFRKEHKEMSGELSESLGNFVKDLTKNVGAMMRAITKAHKEMAENLESDLEKGEVDRLKAFKAMMGDINKGIKDIETYVASKLKEFNNAHADMSEELKKELSKYVAGVVSETKKMLSGFADERENMAANWQALTVTMAKKRGGRPLETRGKPVVSASEKVMTVGKALAEPKKRGRKKGGKRKKKA